jgi:hypothetical protein
MRVCTEKLRLHQPYQANSHLTKPKEHRQSYMGTWLYKCTPIIFTKKLQYTNICIFSSQNEHQIHPNKAKHRNPIRLVGSN